MIAYIITFRPHDHTTDPSDNPCLQATGKFGAYILGGYKEKIERIRKTRRNERNRSRKSNSRSNSIFVPFSSLPAYVLGDFLFIAAFVRSNKLKHTGTTESETLISCRATAGKPLIRYLSLTSPVPTTAQPHDHQNWRINKYGDYSAICLLHLVSTDGHPR